jgi:ferric-dicitrate binding protein FerR (iron transport regulator)
MVRRSMMAGMLTAVILSAAPVLAGEKEGKVQTINAAERSMTLEDGTKVWLSQDVAADAVKEGDSVKVMYEERDGKNVAVSVEAK